MIPNLRRSAPIAAACACVFAAGLAHAGILVPIPGLFNTGLTAGGLPVPFGMPDGNYTVSASADPGAPAGGPAMVPFPAGAWAPNSPTSQWINPIGVPDFQPGGIYAYTTTFFLPPSLDPATATIFGLWGADDENVDIVLNTVPLGIARAGSPDYTTLAAFSIPAGSPFATGLNTLTFVTSNVSAFGPTGLRIEGMMGLAAEVPAPGPAGLLGLAALAGIGRRRR